MSLTMTNLKKNPRKSWISLSNNLAHLGFLRQRPHGNTPIFCRRLQIFSVTRGLKPEWPRTVLVCSPPETSSTRSCFPGSKTPLVSSWSISLPSLLSQAEEENRPFPDTKCSRVFWSEPCQNEAEMYHTAFYGLDCTELQRAMDSSYTSIQRCVVLHLKVAGLFAKRRKEVLIARHAEQPSFYLFPHISNATRELACLKWTNCAWLGYPLLLDCGWWFAGRPSLRFGVLPESLYMVYAGAVTSEEGESGYSGTLPTVFTFINYSCEGKIAGPFPTQTSSRKLVLDFVHPRTSRREQN